MKIIKPKSYNEGNAPFNMALFTLEKIHDILKAIIKSSILITDSGEFISQGTAQHTKYRMVRQLYIQSIPLLNFPKLNDWHKKTMDQIKELGDNLQTRRLYRVSGNGMKKDFIGFEERYSKEVEDELDELTIDIQKKLQEEGYFMPSKSDPRFGWQQ